MSPASATAKGSSSLSDLQREEWRQSGGHAQSAGLLPPGGTALIPVSIRRAVAKTAPDISRAQAPDRPAWTPSAIRALLAAKADAAVVRRNDAELDAAYEQARGDGDHRPRAYMSAVQRLKRDQWVTDGPAGHTFVQAWRRHTSVH